MSILSKIKSIFKKKTSSPAVAREPYSTIIPTLKIKETRINEVKAICQKFYANRERYHVVSQLTKVPEDVIFAIHMRECSADFRGVLCNGERIIGTGKKTKLVPSGRGPFATWEESAIDEMEHKKHLYPKDGVWTMEAKLVFCEGFNGLGYKNRGLPSPYVLSWTNGYTKGKYVADGKFDPDFVDKQCGTAAIILELGL